MVASANDITIHRLLIQCEHQLNNVNEWSDGDKSKYALYIRYLQQSNSSPRYAERIQRLTDRLKQQDMHVDTNKGVMEMQATKQLVLDGLKRLQQPDEPEWLQQLKAMPEEEEEPIKQQSERDKGLDTRREEQQEDHLRRRRRSTTREQETSNIENVLQHHRQMHDELTGDLSRMAAQLKLNSQSFGDTLAKDDKVLQDAQQAVANNLDRLRKERKRLDEHYSKSWGTSFMTMGVVLFVCIVFFLVFFTIKFLPKA
ncbi:hypothetical protein O0I10_004090 [Lichtheimia ornata]|uniref:Vesicle transport protein USE1 n=1 Tax=Lichtheimia ornata TaxID=688661 RepID=A0AAD7XZJ4_9FUNG|nr:uncharacterized protein O0I10_004090 [Lichtheimia ornata]KAJ8660230.1 hypothetical protein O0I10_004090 [Lichtheimia ornata]